MMKRPVSRPKRKARPAKGTVLVIASLFLGSAAVRLAVGADQALALDENPAAMVEAPSEAACEPPPDVATVLSALNERAKRLDERESQISKRLQILATADAEISKRMAELVEAEEALRATIALADSAAENDIARLVSVYENMKPKDAAALFEQMDPSFAAGFLARMRPEAAAGVMTGLKPETAYTISAILAGRNTNVPTE